MAFLGLRSGASRLRLVTGTAHDVFGKLFASRFTIPLLKGFIWNLSLYEKLSEFSSLSLALEGHCSSEAYFSSAFFIALTEGPCFFTSDLNSSCETPSFLAQSLRS
jgi:hypothetical protein